MAGIVTLSGIDQTKQSTMRIKKQCPNSECRRMVTVVITWQEDEHDYQIPCPKCGEAQVAGDWKQGAEYLIK